MVADKTCVVADLRIDGKSYGPHAFVMDLRKNGQVVEGVSHGDMGIKTVGNDLDNAWIAFNNVHLDKSAMLNRYADLTVDENGITKYIQKVKGMPVFHMIGQRLFTGRVAVAQAALIFCREIFKSTKAYTDNKECWGPQGNVPLSSLPHLNHLYEEAESTCSKIETFVNACERDLSNCLRSNSMPSVKLVEAIAAAKVRAVEEAISFTHRLRNEVGSYALMKDSGFGQTDFLQCCKFAEGDSRILMQKMARDRMKRFMTEEKNTVDDEESQLCLQLKNAIEQDITSGKAANKHIAWELRWREVYELANAIINKTISDYETVETDAQMVHSRVKNR